MRLSFPISRFLLILTVLFCAAFSAAVAGESDIRAVEGVIDLSDCNLHEIESITLDGEWSFYWEAVVSEDTGYLPADLEPNHFVEVPSYWDVLGETDPLITARGTATYVLEIIMPADSDQLALKFLNVTPNAEIYVNGVHRMELGNVDQNPELSRSGSSALVIPLSCTGSRMTVSVSISNHHNVNGGLNRSVQLGLYENIRQIRESMLSLDALFLGGLLLMGLYQLALFLMTSRRKAPLYMALLCVLAFFFAGFKNEMVLLALFPGWGGEVRTTFIYISLALAPAAFSWYAFSLYPAHLNRQVNLALGLVSGLLALFILLTSKAIFTHLLLPLEIMVVLAALYNLFMLVRGYIRSRDWQILLYLFGLLFLILSIFVGILDNAVSGIVRSISGVFFVFILYQAFLQAHIYSYSFREIEFLNVQKAKLEKRNIELFSMSYIDGLTGTCNRRLFDDFLASNWRVNAFSGKTLGMILLDIDEFKDYNEFYGHRQGDICLNRICVLVRAEMNRLGHDTLARYGGEEFAVIVSDVNSSDILDLAEALRKAVEAGGIEHRSSSTASIVTISLGCAVLVPLMDADPETLLDAADVALHQAKTEGRNRTVLHGGKTPGWNPRLV